MKMHRVVICKCGYEKLDMRFNYCPFCGSYLGVNGFATSNSFKLGAKDGE